MTEPFLTNQQKGITICLSETRRKFMKNILVTGGTGFIGSHTSVKLIESGYNVIIADNFSNSGGEILTKIKEITGIYPKFYECDILDFDSMIRIFEENKIDAVIHFAGLKAVGESVKEPIKYYRNNVNGTVTLLRAMQEYECKKIVFSSSATVYGASNPVPYSEHFPVSSTNPYGSTKVMIEQILKDVYCSDNEWSISLLRYFNPIGAGKSGIIGENPNGIPNNLFPYILQVASGRLEHLRVFGNDYDTPDGTGVRDYIHVEDLASGHIFALEYIMKHTGCEAVNLGTGKGTSVLELIQAFESVSGIKIPYIITDRRSGDIDVCYADTKKAEKLFGWKAELNISDMCRDGWNFAQKNFK